MFGDDHWDDYLNEVTKATQDPIREARRHMDELSGAGLVARYARQSFDTQSAIERQLDPMRDAHRALSDRYADIVDQARQPLLDAARLSGVPRRAAAEIERLLDPMRDAHRALSDRYADIVDQARQPLLEAAKLAGVSCAADMAAACGHDAALSQAYMPRDAVASINAYSTQMDLASTAAAASSTHRLAHLGSSLDAFQTARLVADPLDFMKQDFQRIRDAATALQPLETLSDSLYRQFGSTLSADALQQELGLRTWDNPVADHQRAFLDLMDLASSAMGYSAHDEEAEESEDEDDIAAFDDEDGDAGQVAVYSLALRFVPPAYEIHARLAHLASRIDHTATGGTATWERMFLAIAAAYPNYAADLARIAHPLMQRLTWSTAHEGSTIDDSVERLSSEDAEKFEALAQDLLKLLRRIQGSISE